MAVKSPYHAQAQNPHHIPAVPAIHANDVIILFIIRLCHLHSAVVAAPDPHLLQFPLSSIVDAVSDLLAAGSRGVDVEAGGKAAFVHHIVHDVLGHGAAADVAVADKKHSYHI